MTEATVEERALLVVPARAIAVAWLNSFLAAGRDPDRPILYKNLSLEFFETGLHVVGCDGTALFRCWVGKEAEVEWPEVDEAPDRSVVAMDPDGFGLSWMKSLLQSASQKGREYEELTITTAAADDIETPSLGAEFMTERLILRALGQRLDLRLYQDSYPDWRKLQLGVSALERLDGLTIAPRILGIVGKLKDVVAVDLSFRGETKQIDFEARGNGRIQSRGLLMPMMRPDKKATKKADPDEEEEEAE